MKALYPHWDEEYSFEWRRSFGPPVRPTPAECLVYKRELVAFPRGAKALLLGSTPEIRDLAAEFGLALTVIDKSEKNYHELEAFMKNEAGKEKFVKGNWAGMGFEGEFEAAIGDSILSVLSTDDAKKTIERVHKALRAGGKLLTRVMLYDDGEDFISPDTLNGRIRNCVTKKDIYEQLFVPFLAYYKNDTGAVIPSEIYERLKRDVGKGLFPSVCLEVFSALRKYNEENYLVEKGEFEGYLGRFFSIEKRYEEAEAFSKNWVVYSLKKK